MLDDRPRISFKPSAELLRVIDAYATLHGQTRDAYVASLVLDGIEAEAHAKMDLRRIPEIQSRGGPKMQAGPFVRTYNAAFEPPGKLYNSKGLAARLGVSRHMIYCIKRANAFFAERGDEQPIFHGRLSTVERIAEWMDRHRDWAKEYHVLKPEPPPDDAAEMHPAPHVGTGNRHRIMRRHVNQLHRFLGRPATAEDTRNLHGDVRVAILCGFDERLLRAIREAAANTTDNPYNRTAWVSVDGIRRWLQAHQEFVAGYGAPDAS